MFSLGCTENRLKTSQRPKKKKKTTLKNDKSGFLEPQFEEIRDGGRL